MKSLSHVWLLLTPWTVACQAPLSMGFSRQEYWSGLPFPSPQYSILMHIYMEFRKMVMITLYVRQQKETQMYWTVFWSLWERARAGWYGRMALKHVNYMWNESPVQVRCMIQGAQGWCTGMTQRDGMGREMGGGSEWGTHVHSWWIHVNVWLK